MPEPREPPQLSKVYRLAEKYQAALRAREEAFARQAFDLFFYAWRDLYYHAMDLYREVEDLRKQGKEIDKHTIWRLQRYRILDEELRKRMQDIYETLSPSLQELCQDAIRIADEAALEQICAGLPKEFAEKVRANFASVYDDAVEAIQSVTFGGHPLREIVEQAVGVGADEFLWQLTAGLTTGIGPRELARRLRQRFGLALTRCLRIARTEQLRAYRIANLMQYRRNADVVKGWERVAAADTRTCLACILLDGKRYSLDEEMDDHIQGRCRMVPITYSWKELGYDVEEPKDLYRREKALDWFLRQPEAVQRRMMGPGYYDAWKSGKIDLQDMLQFNPDPVWGNSWTVRPLYRALRAAEGLEEPEVVRPEDMEAVRVQLLREIGFTEDQIRDWTQTGSHMREARARLSYYSAKADYKGLTKEEMADKERLLDEFLKPRDSDKAPPFWDKKAQRRFRDVILAYLKEYAEKQESTFAKRWSVEYYGVDELKRSEDLPRIVRMAKRHLGSLIGVLGDIAGRKKVTVEVYFWPEALRAKCTAARYIHVPAGEWLERGAREWAKATLWHEFGHALEGNDEAIRKIAVEFLRRRHIPGEEYLPLYDPKDEKDWAYWDTFLDEYAGKFYGTWEDPVATEIVSMGLQHLWENPLTFAVQDPEYFNLMMAILTGRAKYWEWRD